MTVITNAARTEIAQAVAKAIAYKNCGDQRKAESWAAKIIYLLDVMDLCDQTRLGHALAAIRE